MKPKRTKHAKAAKQSRTTLAKRIRAEISMERKLNIAQGMDTLGAFNIYSGPESIIGPEARLPLHRLTEDELFGVVYNIQGRFTPADELDYLGIAAFVAIQRGDHKFFSRIAAILQFKRKPEPHKLYVDILDFCTLWDGGIGFGTEQNPCNPWKLLKHLEANGHRFTYTHDNQLPRTLLVMCKKLGVHMRTKKPGRPSKKPQR